jgi:hypothetical protein
MAARDRIRLTGSLRERPHKGPLLFGSDCPEFWPYTDHKSGQTMTVLDFAATGCIRQDSP